MHRFFNFLQYLSFGAEAGSGAEPGEKNLRAGARARPKRGRF